MEVINAIMKLKGYNMKEVEKVMKAKEEKKGAFNNKIFLEYVDEEKIKSEEYVKKYGPLEVIDTIGSKFNWINSPWPWEEKGGSMYV